MKTAKMLTILVLSLGQVASAAQSLTVNGEAIDAITLKAGQVCTVEILSDDSNSYNAYVGFDDCVVLGSFDEPLVMPEAGDLASIIEYDEPSFCGYYVSAAGKPPGPSPGVHFTILYKPKEVGETELKLYDQSLTSVIDSLHITVVPAWMGTVFTYQGRLMESGNPADGHYDFEFMLYNAPSYGSQLAGTVEANDLDVIDGYFMTELDFGSDVFNGDAVWLQISVRPGDSNDPNTFINLSPRQEVTPTPYALYTHVAGMAIDSIQGGGTSSYIAKFASTNTIENSLIYQSDNKVGIGTTNPQARLSIQMPSGPMSAIDVDGLVIRGGLWNQGDHLEVQDFSGNTKLVIRGGRIGIGTASPEVGLHLKGAGWPYSFVHMEGDEGHDAGVRLYEGTTAKWHIFNSTADNGLRIYNSDGSKTVFFAEQSTGNVGIGTTSPSGILYTSSKNLEIQGISPSIVLDDTDGTAQNDFEIVNGGDRVLFRDATAGINVLSLELSGTRNTIVRALEITGGSDLSERFQVSAEDEQVKPGMVVCIDPENPGDLVVSKTTYDRTVAGIVSGAGGVKPGMLMGQEGTEAYGKHPVALSGRVYCWADASKSSIESGDLLTTSDTPGHAMKVTDYNKSQGATLGKAMTSLKEGKGLILVLVSLQ